MAMSPPAAPAACTCLRSLIGSDCATQASFRWPVPASQPARPGKVSQPQGSPHHKAQLRLRDGCPLFPGHLCGDHPSLGSILEAGESVDARYQPQQSRG
ncbi:hypothetical protein NDU88_005464 [Pleurodeles waltl]|uniref:Uncharacterized protein n=1 Tax=Pleurodeles waltl TaxID=8319 RepID=A0AAV7RNC8_PLEWA|nr:hypothetical protein NDU88_005464 [Pleurodeles waltl]